MKHHFLIGISLLSAFAASTLQPVEAAPLKTMYEEHTYMIRAEEDKYEREGLFNEHVITDDGTYLLQDVRYDVEEKTPVPADTFYKKTLTETTTVDHYAPRESYREAGVDYHLVDVSVSEKVLEEGYDQMVTASEVFDEGVAVPERKTVQETVQQNGHKVSVICDLQSVVETEGKWITDSIPVTYHNYGADFYSFVGYEIQHAEDKPALAGYEEAILLDAGYDPELWEITDINWSGDPYESDGEICRNAVAEGRRYEKQYRAEYAGNIHADPIKAKVYTCSYEGDAPESSEYEYTIHAVATYKLEKALNQGMDASTKVLIGIGVLAIACIDVLTLARIANKKKEKL